jgi:hypothetical protein
VFAARRASSWEGDTGDESIDAALLVLLLPVAVVVADGAVERPPVFILELLLLRWRTGGDVRAVSMGDMMAFMLRAGDSRADDVADDGGWRGVMGSADDDAC